jgi:hypothetical protein
MSHRNAKIIISLALTLVLGWVLIIASCKKSTPEAPKSPEKTTAKTEAPKPAEKSTQPETKPVEAPKPAPQPVAQAPAEKPAAAQPAGDMEPIPLVLPKPAFVGTPEKVVGISNLEKQLGKPREPFFAPKGTTNVASHKPVTGSDEQPIIGELAMVTNGDKEASDGSYVELGPGKQFVTIDLGGMNNIYAIVIWHYHKQARVYKDVVAQVADDPDFIKNVRTVFNNDNENTLGLGAGTNMNYVETSEGKLIDAKGIVGRYVRCYSNGNSSNDLNNYIEVEVYGMPAK